MIKKVFVLYLVFTLFFMYMFGEDVTADALEGFKEIYDGIDLVPEDMMDCFVITSNGTYYTGVYEMGSSDNDLRVYKSYNEGFTWQYVFTWDVTTWDSGGNDGFSMLINYDDEIFLFSGETWGGGYAYMRKFDGSPGGDDEILVSKADINSVATTSESMPIACCDRYNNIYVYQEINGTKIWGRKYNDQLDTWNTEDYCYDGNVIPNGCMAVDSDSDGDVWLSFIESDGNYFNISYMFYDRNADDYTVNVIPGSPVLSDELNVYRTDLAIDQDDGVHIVYESNYSGHIAINYSYKEVGESWVHDNIINSSSYDYYAPSITISADGEIHVVFHGITAEIGSNYILSKTGEYGAWDQETYHISGSSDSNIYPQCFFQNYPRNTWLSDGFIGSYVNQTDDDFCFFATGTQVMYEGDLYSDYDECEDDTWLVQKLFDDSIAYTNETVYFNYYSKLLQYGSYIIINQDEDVVKYGAINNLVGTVSFKPQYERDYGTCYIKFKTNSEVNYGFSCEFTVVNDTGGDSVLGDWKINFGKESYYEGEQVWIYYTIPDGYEGTINLYWNEVYYDSWENIVGDGTQHSKQVISSLGSNTIGSCWQVNMLNASDEDTPQVVWDYMCVEGMTTNIELWLQSEGQFTCNVNAQDKVKIFGSVDWTMDDLWLRVYRDNSYEYLETAWYLGTWNIDSFSFNWYPENYSTGVEDFFVVIEGNEFIYDLGVDRIVYVYDIGDDDFDNDTSDIDDDDENFWVGVPVSTWKVGVALFVIILFMFIPYLITKKWENVPSLVLGVCGLIIDIYLDLVPIFVAYMLIILVVVYFVYRMLRS